MHGDPTNLPEAPGDDAGQGLRDEPRPSRGGIAAALALGGMWGLFGYSVLWEGAPFAVDRPFVESLAGTLVLLPVRIVLWAIHTAEGYAGHPFSLSDSTSKWIALGAAVAGALLVMVAFVLVRGVAQAFSGRRARA